MEIKNCKRCGSQWCFRGSGRPVRCGKCKSPYWDRERQGEVDSQVSQKEPVIDGRPHDEFEEDSIVHDPEICQEYGCKLCRKLRQEGK